jgi:hypothetical protein
VTDESAASLAKSASLANDSGVTARDREIVRRLASEVAELAARPVEQEKRDLWYRHNALDPTRPLVFCDPENGWNEIITQDQIECESPLARGWEMRLRKEVFWGREMRDDRVIQPFFDIPHTCSESDWGMSEVRTSGGPGGAYTWDPPLKTYDDLHKLRFPQITVDHDATQRALDLANEVLGNILTVRLKTAWWWSFGMTWTLIRLRGLEQMMLDMTDQPEGLHRLMAFLRDGHLAKFDFLEANGLLYLNNDGTYVGSGGFGWTRELPQPDFADHVRTMDMWGFAESQETVGVSPDMFEEFVYQYQLPLMSRFGLNCYGCCEPVDGRWHVIKDIPRLRRVSVSAWCDIERTAEMLSDKFIFSWKPNPADLAAPTFDEDRIRRDIRRAFEIARGCRVEIIMKDNHTICGDPTRATRWTRIAREEADRM